MDHFHQQRSEASNCTLKEFNRLCDWRSEKLGGKKIDRTSAFEMMADLRAKGIDIGK